MVITRFVRAEFDRAVQEELFDIKFIGFGEGLVTVFLQNAETCKNVYKSNGNNRMFISSVLVRSARLLASFCHLMVEKHQRSVYLLLLYT